MIIKKKNWVAELESSLVDSDLVQFKFTEFVEDWSNGTMSMNEEMVSLDDLRHSKEPTKDLIDKLYLRVKTEEKDITSISEEMKDGKKIINVTVKKKVG